MRDVITMASLSSNKIGRGFGNKLFQYGFLKTYAKKYHLNVEVPEWIGRFLFGHKDPYISKPLPTVQQISPCLERDLIPNAKEPFKNVDFVGYFQYHTKFYAPFKDYFCSLFQPVPRIRVIMDNTVMQLPSMGKTIIGLHLRRGDYEKHQYSKSFCFIPPNGWYIQWLKDIWNTVDNPILFIASDEPKKVLDDFSSFNPITNLDLGITLPEASYYPDFYILTQCDMVATSNSTFSFIACMLNKRAQLFMRPHPPSGALVPFNPWNSEVLYRTDYPWIRYSFNNKPDQCN